jgi:hypothetical protein
MKIFLSWSKPLSRCVAAKLNKWLQNIFPHADIFMSSEDIKTGTRWNTEISKELETTSFGILVLTSENAEAPWIHFEAGALSKVLTEARVCPLLVDINNSNIPGPLAQFMSASIDRDGVMHLLKSINHSMEPSFQNKDEWVENIIDVWWPQLEDAVKACKRECDVPIIEEAEQSPSERMLEQVLQFVRLISERIESAATQQDTATEVEKDRRGLGQMLSTVLDQSAALIQNYRQEIPILQSFGQAGIIGLYKNRRLGLAGFTDTIRRSKEELYIIGSSLKGLILEREYEDVATLILAKSKEKKLQLRFLLTHPCVADLRARQEKRNRMEIGKEVIDSLRKLESWNIPEKCVKLYMGTPTCFGIMADDAMLLNPYPYGGVSYNAPCLVVQRKYDATGFFFDAFETSHFGVWESQATVKVDSYSKTIQHLEEALSGYSNLIDNLLSDEV